jgi:hypothetical protein
LFQQEIAEAVGQQPELCCGRGMSCKEYELAVLKAGGADLGGEFRREELIAKTRKCADFERFCDNGLDVVVGREIAVDLGKSHGSGEVRSGSCRLS